MFKAERKIRWYRQIWIQLLWGEINESVGKCWRSASHFQIAISILRQFKFSIKLSAKLPLSNYTSNQIPSSLHFHSWQFAMRKVWEISFSSSRRKNLNKSMKNRDNFVNDFISILIIVRKALAWLSDGAFFSQFRRFRSDHPWLKPHSKSFRKVSVICSVINENPWLNLSFMFLPSLLWLTCKFLFASKAFLLVANNVKRDSILCLNYSLLFILIFSLFASRFVESSKKEPTAILLKEWRLEMTANLFTVV